MSYLPPQMPISFFANLLHKFLFNTLVCSEVLHVCGQNFLGFPSPVRDKLHVQKNGNWPGLVPDFYAGCFFNVSVADS